jgi:hypothetical protein
MKRISVLIAAILVAGCSPTFESWLRWRLYDAGMRHATARCLANEIARRGDYLARPFTLGEFGEALRSDVRIASLDDFVRKARATLAPDVVPLAEGAAAVCRRRER